MNRYYGKALKSLVLQISIYRIPGKVLRIPGKVSLLKALEKKFESKGFSQFVIFCKKIKDDDFNIF